MQVGTSAPDTPYAAIGGAQVQNFQIASSAHGFKILSSTLYTNKIRAVVRETLCNAIDAHIASGVNRPVEVTLTDEAIEFRDYGLGIPDSQMVSIYCTYFASTKTQDGRQTGGFGLGCKSPFAYSDHFTVTSRHAGAQTVYALAIGAQSTDGAPSLRKMVSVPTQEQGLSVSIPLENPHDRNKFERELRSVVYEGGMNVLLNGQKLPAFDYAKSEHRCFAFVRGLGDAHGSKIRVLCGNVTYAIASNPRYAEKLTELCRVVARHDECLVLRAPPGSVSPKPDREGLTLDEETIETLHGLMERSIRFIKSEIQRLRIKLVRDQVEKTPRLTEDLSYEFYNSIQYCEGNSIERAAYMSFGRRHDALFPNDPIHNLFARAMRRKHRENRKSLTRVLRRQRSNREDVAYIIVKRVLRIHRLAGAGVRIYARTHAESGLTPMIERDLQRLKDRKCNRLLVSRTLDICFTRTREEASMRLSTGYAFVFGREVNEDLLKILSDKATKLGFTVKQEIRDNYAPPKRSVRVKTDEPAYLPFKLGGYVRAGAYALPLTATVTKPSAYFGVGIGRTTIARNSSSFSAHIEPGIATQVQAFKSNVVVATTKTELTALKKAGVPLYQQWLLDQAIKRLARPHQSEIVAWLYAVQDPGARRTTLSWFEYGYRNDIASLINHASARVIGAILCLDRKLRNDDDWRFWRHFIEVSRCHIQACALTPEFADEVNAVVNKMAELIESTAKDSKHLALQTSDSDKTQKTKQLSQMFSVYKSVLTYTRSEIFEKPNNVDLAIEIIRFERRRQSKTKPQVAAHSEGEAA